MQDGIDELLIGNKTIEHLLFPDIDFCKKFFSNTINYSIMWNHPLGEVGPAVKDDSLQISIVLVLNFESINLMISNADTLFDS